jgi:hypothetical protein
VQRQTLGRVGRIVPGEFLDLGEAVGDGANRHVQSTRRFSRDSARGEVGLHRLQQRLGAAAGPGQRLQQGVNQVDQGFVVAGQDAVDQQLVGLDDVVVVVQPSGQQPGLASFLV